MENKNTLKKIAQLQTVGNNVIEKTISTTNNYRRSIDSLEWLGWTEIEVQEITDTNIIIKNLSIDYSKVTNPSYGRATLPLRILKFSDRDFAKFVRLLVKASQNRRKVSDSFYAEEEIKRLQVALEYQVNLLNNKEKNHNIVQKLANSIKENYPDFAHPNFVQWE